jgi:hypothetical protein
MSHLHPVDTNIEKTELEHDEHAEKHLDPASVAAAISGHDKKWERRTIRKIDARLLIIRTSFTTIWL